MFKRKIYNSLLNWKNTHDKECLFVRGARQIGKTFIIREFGKNEYKSFIELNFFINPNLKKIFDGSLEPEEIYSKISIYLDNCEFIEHNTLIFLDEIQECGNARTALKFLAEDNKYDIICSGSLLGINYKDIQSVPVGYENSIEMFSMDFEEFLWANGKNEKVTEKLKDIFNHLEKIDNDINDTFNDLLKKYIAIGGMPEVVKKYIETKNIEDANKVQNKILDNYNEDIKKYASSQERQKISLCYKSLPKQLARENKKFLFSLVKTGGNSRKFKNSLLWLYDAGMIKIINNVTEPILPLVSKTIDDEYKIYTTDTGLLMALFGIETQKAFLRNELLSDVKGGIYENLVFNLLIRNNNKMWYYRNIGSTKEIEFVIEKDGGVIPIEVKAMNGTTKSLNDFIEKYQPKIAYKFIAGNIGIVDNKITLPHYLAMYIK